MSIVLTPEKLTIMHIKSDDKNSVERRIVLRYDAIKSIITITAHITAPSETSLVFIIKLLLTARN